MRSNSYNFYLSEKPEIENNTNPSDPYIFNVDSNITEENSTSLEITNKSIYSSPNNIHLGNISNDYIYFKTNSNEEFKIKIPFILYHNIMGNMPGVIGLKAIINEIYKEYNFIDKLKTNEIINSYVWMINYTSNDEGNLIIGEFPHIFDPLSYKENELFYSHPFSHESTDDWGLRFDKITFKDKNINSRYPCLFNYEYNYIQGIESLEKELDIYFNESIQNKKCYKIKIKYPYAPHKFFYCDKEYINNIKYFPSLKFFHNELNYTFELNYKDLFVEKYDKLVLMIFFDEYTIEWYFGKPFLKKYMFLMNQDSKLLGFYYRKKAEKKNFDYSFVIILIILGILILFILGIFIGKYLVKEKKKIINIIDEDYDYTSKNNEIN